MAQEGAQGPQAPEPAVSQPLSAPHVEGAQPRGKWASVGGAEVPEWVGTGELKGASQGVPGPLHKPAAEGQAGAPWACGPLKGGWWTGEAQVGNRRSPSLPRSLRPAPGLPGRWVMYCRGLEACCNRAVILGSEAPPCISSFQMKNSRREHVR